MPAWRWAVLIVLVCLALPVVVAQSDQCYDTDACRTAFQETVPRCRGRYCGRPSLSDDCGVRLLPWWIMGR